MVPVPGLEYTADNVAATREDCMMRIPMCLCLLAGLVGTVACSVSAVPEAPDDFRIAAVGSSLTPPEAIPETPDDFQIVAVADARVQLEAVAADLSEPWGMDFLDARTVLVTERGGAVLKIDLVSGRSHRLEGVPESAKVGQGGMLDVMVRAEVGAVPRVYLSYSIAGENGYTTRIARARLRGNRLENLEVLFTAMPYYSTRRHFGSRLVMHGGYLFFTIGDRGNRDFAQDLGRHNGKLMRLFPDGRVPPDNPFVETPGARPEIWSYGHRNPQGLAVHPDGASLWAVEHGPRGGDEINRIEAGVNYGWPLITYGEEYAGGSIGEGTHGAGLRQPVKFYVPSIAVCGTDFYSGNVYPGWRDSLLIAALRATHLNRSVLDGDGFAEEFRLFGERGMRFRDVQQGPDGYVYVLAGDGLYRLVNAG